MYQASLRHSHLVTQVVPSPLTFDSDATIQDIIKQGTLGELLYIEVNDPHKLHGLVCGHGLLKESLCEAVPCIQEKESDIADTAGQMQLNPV